MTPTPGQPLSEADVSLLNCPFCGGPASAEMSVRADTYGEWIAGCDNEQCAPQPYAIGKDKKASIAAWNRRPHAPVSRPAGEGETTQHTPRCWGRTSYSDEMAHCYCKPAGEGEREAVARIIDPSAFLFAPDELPKGSRAQYDAFDKADAIISLLSPAAPDAGGGGEEDIMRTQEDWSALLYGRDSFIVRKGLWSEFVDSLPALQPGGER